MEWLNDLFQVLGLWLFFAAAVAAGSAVGIKHALKNITLNVNDYWFSKYLNGLRK
jgi:hypothetical protein